VRLPIGPFFAVSSLLLCVLAVSFAGSGIFDLVSAGYLPPRPVRFLEIPALGIHPDLTALLVQLAIVAVGVHTFARRETAVAPASGAATREPAAP
jgi:high-affinity iron transporter